MMLLHVTHRPPLCHMDLFIQVCSGSPLHNSEVRGVGGGVQLCWRRFLRVPWITRRSTQSVLKEINHEYSLEGLMLKLKLQYFGHLDVKS